MTLLDFANETMTGKKVVIWYNSVAQPMGDYILPDNEAWNTVGEWELWDLEGEIEDDTWKWDGEGEPTDSCRSSIHRIEAYVDNKRFDELMDENYGS